MTSIAALNSACRVSPRVGEPPVCSKVKAAGPPSPKGRRPSRDGLKVPFHGLPPSLMMAARQLSLESARTTARVGHWRTVHYAVLGHRSPWLTKCGQETWVADLIDAANSKLLMERWAGVVRDWTCWSGRWERLR